MWVPGYGLNIHQLSWLSFFESRNFITSCTCSSNLKYAKKIQQKKKTEKIYLKVWNYPKFEQGVLNNVGRSHKKWGKITKKITSPSALPSHSGTGWWGQGCPIFRQVKDNSFRADVTHWCGFISKNLDPCNLSTTIPLVINRVTIQLTSPRRLIPACEMKNTSKNSKEAALKIVTLQMND
jgi:hypothetical protein